MSFKLMLKEDPLHTGIIWRWRDSFVAIKHFLDKVWLPDGSDCEIRINQSNNDK